jgi:hypothetical protein
MANIRLTLYKTRFFGSVLKSPTQMGSLGVKKLGHEYSISRRGAFRMTTMKYKTPNVLEVLYYSNIFGYF